MTSYEHKCYVNGTYIKSEQAWPAFCNQCGKVGQPQLENGDTQLHRRAQRRK